MKIQLNHQVKEKKGGFYLSQIEDYHPGDRLSESSELFCLLEVEGIVTYVFQTNNHTSK